MSDITLSKEKKKLFEDNGYCIIERPAESNILLEAQKSFFDIKKKVKLDQYPYFRIYDDYSLNKNIAGIEMTFHKDILTESIMKLIINSKVLEITKEIMGKEVELALSRIHVTEGFSHVGIWHRDEVINHSNNSLQINIFLFDEMGLQVIEDSHKKEIPEEEILKKTPHASLKKSKWVKTNAGDILVFNPAILHRGISANPRANIHFRFKKKKNETKVVRLNYENLNIPKDWKDILENSSTGVNDSILKPYIFKKDLKSNFFRLLRKIIHNFIFFLPLSSRLYYRFNVWPNLKLRELFSLKT